MSKPSAKTPLLVSIGFVASGLLLALVASAILGGVVAGLGVIPAAWAAWSGMQQETQASLAGAIGMVFVSVCTGIGLIVLGIFGKIF